MCEKQVNERDLKKKKTCERTRYILITQISPMIKALSGKVVPF